MLEILSKYVCYSPIITELNSILQENLWTKNLLNKRHFEQYQHVITIFISVLSSQHKKIIITIQLNNQSNWLKT
jgi:hypothetical protein